MHLLATLTLTPDPQPVATVAKRLRMTKDQLQDVIAQHRAALEAQGMRLHGATQSEVARAIALPSLANGSEPTYYSRISKEPPRES